MLVEGSVRFWRSDDGWGVIDSPATPGGCWAHFSVIDMEGYRHLQEGQRVSVEAENVDQDGYAYRALLVIPHPR